MTVEIFFMTKSPRKNVPDVGIELGVACMRTLGRPAYANNRDNAYTVHQAPLFLCCLHAA